MKMPPRAPRMAVIVSMMSGLESFVKREVEALVDRGYSLRLFATKYRVSPGFDPRPDIPFYTPSPLAVIHGLTTWGARNPRKIWSLFCEAVQLNGVTEYLLALSWASILKKKQIELIHCAFGDRKFFIGYFLHRLTDLPLTVAIHAHEIYAQPNPPLFRRALKYAAGIVTISEKNKSLLCEKFGLAETDVNLIRLSIDLDFWKHDTMTINVLTVARFTPRKGWQELIAAAKQLGPSFHFYGVGFGDMDVEGLAKKAGVSHHFTVFPKLQPPHLRLLMEACDIFCLPSRPTEEEGSEGIPVVLMEAMAMGMSVVTTNDGSISELVEHEVVPAGDVNALVDSLHRSGNQRVLFKRTTIDENRERVIRMHSEKNLAQLDAFFRSKAQQV